MNQWSKIQYAQALQKLIEDVDPRFDAPGHWSTFLREQVKDAIARLESRILGLSDMHLPKQQEQFNLLTGEIKGLRWLLKDDLGIADALKDAIEEQT